MEALKCLVEQERAERTKGVKEIETFTGVLEPVGASLPDIGHGGFAANEKRWVIEPRSI